MASKRQGGLLAAALLAVFGCGDPTGPPERLDELPRQLTVAEREVLSASNDFTFRLLRGVVADDELGAGNVFLSPFSVSMALGMALNGADGDTYAEMRSVLGFDALSEAEINASYRDLTELLLGLDRRTEVRIANSVWAREGFPFHDAFFDAVREYFGATALELDFDAPGAPDLINGWVSDATNGRIEEIVHYVDPLDVMFLINAVYFKGQWRTRFDPDETRPSTFYLEGAEEQVQVPTMHAHERIEAGLFGGRGIEGGELPYGNGAFNMVLVMPRDGESVDDLVASLDDDGWTSWMDDIQYLEDVTVELPKWELEYEARLDPVLDAMGMETAFDEVRADFTRLTPDSSVYISRVRHKTFLKVDEEGTEAAAATSVGFSAGSLGPQLVVNRPFLVAIRERISGTILFIGVVRDPR